MYEGKAASEKRKSLCTEKRMGWEAARQTFRWDMQSTRPWRQTSGLLAKVFPLMVFPLVLFPLTTACTRGPLKVRLLTPVLWPPLPWPPRLDASFDPDRWLSAADPRRSRKRRWRALVSMPFCAKTRAAQEICELSLRGRLECKGMLRPCSERCLLQVLLRGLLMVAGSYSFAGCDRDRNVVWSSQRNGSTPNSD